MQIENIIENFKQFIAVTVSQATANLASKDDIAGLATKSDLIRVETKVDSLARTTSDINLKLETIADAHAESIQNHELRVSRLETTS